MADTKTPDTGMKQDKENERLRSEANKSDANQTMRQEQAKAEVSGSKGQEKSAIGGDSTTSQTGEPGRARNELDQDKKSGQFDKSRSEPAGQKS